MCITFFYISHDSSKPIKFFIAFNREENVSRPTLSLGEFAEDPNIIGGRDMRQKGTWLGYNKKTHNIAFLTNYFIPYFIRNPTITYKSRGEITGKFLKTDFFKQGVANKTEILEYLRQIKNEKKLYPPFNLVLGNIKLMKFYYFGNKHRFEEYLIVESGLYSMCNYNMFFENMNERENLGVEYLEKLISEGKKDVVNEISELMMGKISGDDKTTVFKNFPLFTTLTMTTSILAIDQNNDGVFREITYLYKFPLLAKIFASMPYGHTKKEIKIKDEQI